MWLNKVEHHNACLDEEVYSRGLETVGWSGERGSWEHTGAVTACTRGQSFWRWGGGAGTKQRDVHREKRAKGERQWERDKFYMQKPEMTC